VGCGVCWLVVLECILSLVVVGVFVLVVCGFGVGLCFVVRFCGV
jgi:hypothetical protein